MKKVFFDFDENEGLYIFSADDIEYKMPFKLMIELKRYLREADAATDSLLLVRKWYVQLNKSDKQKVKLSYRNVKITL